METDIYKTITKPSEELLYKEKNSKFFAQTFPVDTEEDIKSILETKRKQHPNANHVCYAWQLGMDTVSFRANDDGEPSNSAGMPIYGQIQSFGVTNILITVTRYFGGTKLGVGGLISAYRTAAKMALEASKIELKRIELVYKVLFAYSEINGVMRILKQHSINIVNQKMELDCQIEILIPKNDVEEIRRLFESLPKVTIEKV